MNDTNITKINKNIGRSINQFEIALKSLSSAMGNCSFISETWQNVPLKNEKPYFRQKERY